MIQNPNITAFIVLTFGVLAYILIMLLPTFLELKQPKDAGPRIILEYPFSVNPEIKNKHVVNIEEEQRFDQRLVKRIAEIIAVLPNLEM